jgi:phosphoglycerate dehydrogenase-like enzyme
VRIAVLDDYQAVAPPYFEGLDAVVFHDHVDDDDALVARLEPFDAVVAMRERTPFTAARLERLPRLRLLVTTGMGNASFDMDAAAARGITVCGTGGIGGSTAELTWGLILALARDIPRADAAVRAGAWQTTVGVDLAGATLGVVGHGRLGSRVAAIGRAFGMDVIAWSQNLREAEGAEVVSKQELFERADVVTVHLKLSARTTGLIGAQELAWMKPTAYLVNTSRGPIVDEAALLDALRSGAIAGAGLDVFDAEPLPRDHPLRGAPRTVLTPHLGYVTKATYDVFYREAAEDVRAFAAGSPIRVLTA